jgi:hypothetical protein
VPFVSSAVACLVILQVVVALRSGQDDVDGRGRTEKRVKLPLGGQEVKYRFVYSVLFGHYGYYIK